MNITATIKKGFSVQQQNGKTYNFGTGSAVPVPTSLFNHSRFKAQVASGNVVINHATRTAK
jgi:hypothetical protein